MRASSSWPTTVVLLSLSLPACSTQSGEQPDPAPQVVVAHPQTKSVTVDQRYVGQIQSHRHIKVRAVQKGYLEATLVTEGQTVKQGDVLFKILPVLKQTKGELVAAELNLGEIKAPFDGIVDRLVKQQGSLVLPGEVLTALSNNSEVWVYFNVPEARYLECINEVKEHPENLQFELELAGGEKYPHPGKLGAIVAEFDPNTGNIPFRADFPNPDDRLRNGQAGTVLVRRVLGEAIVIPQKATFEVLSKRYVFVVDKDDVAHHREIVPQYELDDTFVIKKGVGVDDTIVVEGVRQVSEGEKVQYKRG